MQRKKKKIEQKQPLGDGNPLKMNERPFCEVEKRHHPSLCRQIFGEGVINQVNYGACYCCYRHVLVEINQETHGALKRRMKKKADEVDSSQENHVSDDEEAMNHCLYFSYY